MLPRRLLLIVAVLMGLTALTAGLSTPPSRQPEVPEQTRRTPGSVAPSDVVEHSLDASARRARTVAVDQGDQLRLTVRAPTLDAVQIVGLDQVRALAPETPAVFELLADRPGLYPVELLESGRRLGAVRVTPRQE